MLPGITVGAVFSAVAENRECHLQYETYDYKMGISYKQSLLIYKTGVLRYRCDSWVAILPFPNTEIIQCTPLHNRENYKVVTL